MIEFSNLKEMPKALSVLQSVIKNPERNKKAYNYYYADMDEVLKCVKDPCKEHGFSIVQMPYNEHDVLGVETLLVHDSGEYIKGRFGSRLAKSDPQSVGSQISYYRRYSILALFSLTQEDDDGAAASTVINHASDAQKKMLFSLLGADEYTKNKNRILTLTKKDASKWIEQIKGAK